MASGARRPIEIDIDFTRPESWVRDMADRTRWLREHAPVYWSEKSQLWLVSRFADVSRISTDPELFSSAHGVRPGSAMRFGLLEESGPRHAQLRAVLSRAFAPQLIQRLEGVFRPRVCDVIDEALARGRVEFVQDVATPLAEALFGEMIGLHDADQARMRHVGEGFLSLLDPSACDGALELGRQNMAEAQEILRGALEARRREPRGDMLSVLIGVTRPDALSTLALPELGVGADASSGGSLPADELIEDDDLVALLATLFVIGTRTTRSALSGAMQILIENAAERHLLGRNPDRIPSAVEEIMRLVSPVQSFGRTLTSEVELRGERLRPGDRVLMLYGAANRDPDVFEDAERFRIDRHPRHLGFGIGPHFCLGANLARMATRVFVESLVEVVDQASWIGGAAALEMAPSSMIREYARMDVELAPFAPLGSASSPATSA